MKPDAKNIEIEILRAIAILLTLFQHLSAVIFPHGAANRFITEQPAPMWGGVDLFFCISGYVICAGLIPKLRGTTHQTFMTELARFWRRRFFRIVPATWLWIFISLVATVSFNHSGAFGSLSANVVDAVCAVMNISNWHIYQCVVGNSVCGPNPIYWSLSLEEQFYVFFPFMFLLKRKNLILCLICIFVVQFPFQRLPWKADFGGALWFVRTDAFAVGALIALFMNSQLKDCFEPAIMQSGFWRILIVTALLTGLIVVPKALAVSFVAGAIALICGGLIFLAAYNKGFIMQSGWVRRLFAWVGTRSFSMYLIHMPVYYTINEVFFRISSHPLNYSVPLTGHPYNGFLGALVAISIVIISEINFRFIEVPFRQIGRL